MSKRLVPSRLHELHESKFLLVSRIEFIRSKLSIFSAHVYGVHSAVGGQPDAETTEQNYAWNTMLGPTTRREKIR